MTTRNLAYEASMPRPIRFEARYKNKDSDGISRAIERSTDLGAMTAMAASGVPGIAMSTGAGMLASDGTSPGAMNASVVNILNHLHLANLGNWVANNHQLAQYNASAMGLISMLLTKAPSLYLKSRAQDRVQDPKTEDNAPPSQSE